MYDSEQPFYYKYWTIEKIKEQIAMLQGVLLEKEREKMLTDWQTKCVNNLNKLLKVRNPKMVPVAVFSCERFGDILNELLERGMRHSVAIQLLLQATEKAEEEIYGNKQNEYLSGI